MKRITLLLTLVAIFATSKATIVQTVHLKNGTVLNGYIQHQDRQENITFRSENATICISGKNATTTERVYRITELGKEWIEWAEKNKEFQGSGDTRTLTLNEVIISSDSEPDSTILDTTIQSSKKTFEELLRLRTNITQIKVVEKGAIIKYLEMTPNTYTFHWSDVESISATKRGKTELSGIDRIYQLKNGSEVRGQYAGETYNTLSLFNTNGTVETYNINDVVKYYYKGINNNQTIFEQSKLLDIVRTKAGNTYKGIIVERNFTDNNNYLVIQQSSGGNSQMIRFKDVAEYSKEENKDYNPIIDIILEQGIVVINRLATDSVDVAKEGSLMMISDINNHTIIKGTGIDTQINVEYYNPDHKPAEHFILVRLNKMLAKKKKIVYCFSTDIFEMNKINPLKSETSANNTTKIVYSIGTVGLYALYDTEKRKAIPFEVTK